jgi:hypothetical protein
VQRGPLAELGEAPARAAELHRHGVVLAAPAAEALVEAAEPSEELAPHEEQAAAEVHVLADSLPVGRRVGGPLGHQVPRAGAHPGGFRLGEVDDAPVGLHRVEIGEAAPQRRLETFGRKHVGVADREHRRRSVARGDVEPPALVEETRVAREDDAPARRSERGVEGGRRVLLHDDDLDVRVAGEPAQHREQILAPLGALVSAIGEEAARAKHGADAPR